MLAFIVLAGAIDEIRLLLRVFELARIFVHADHATPLAYTCLQVLAYPYQHRIPPGDTVTCKDCGQPICWTVDHWHHLTPLAALRCTGTEAIEPAPVVHVASQGGF